MSSRNLGPISRDDALTVNVDAQAREAFLLLALSAPAAQPRGGIPYAALHLDDVECLAVELGYDRGPAQTAFPYSLADRGCYLPARELGAYAVAVDPTRRLKKVTLHAHPVRPELRARGPDPEHLGAGPGAAAQRFPRARAHRAPPRPPPRGQSR